MSGAPTLQAVGLAVKRLQWRHHREINAGLAPLGVTLPQWDVLRHLHDHSDASLNALAALTFQTAQAMGTLAGRMIDRGLLVRVPGPGRVLYHRITPKGEDVRVRGVGIVDGVLRDSLGLLSATELATLQKLLTKANPLASVA